MTTTTGRPFSPEELPGEDPVSEAVRRAYSSAVAELVDESRAEAGAAGRQFRVIHRLWRLQVAAQQRDHAVRARWLSARRRPVPEPENFAVPEVAEEIGPALHLPRVSAMHRVEQAVVLGESLPSVLQALEAGTIGVRQAGVIVETWLDLVGGELRPVPESPPAVESVVRLAAELLAKAPSRTAAQLAKEARRLREELTRGAAQARHRAARRDRRVWVEAEEDGMARLCAVLEAAAAHAIHHRLDSIAARVGAEDPPVHGAPELAGHGPDSDQDSGRGGGADLGDGWAGAGRTRRQLRADVLTDLLLAGEPPDMPEHLRGIRGQVTVTVPVLTLLAAGTRAPGGGTRDSRALDGDIPGDEVVPGGPVRPAGGALPGAVLQDPGCAQLAGYGPIPDSVAAAIAAGAPSWTRILTHPLTGVVLDHDRTTYAVPADLKRRLRARDGTCRFPGCRRAAEACDLDHTIAWADGGTTAAGNLAHLCRAHHRLKHRTGPLGRWSVRHRDPRTPEGVLEWTSPAGRVHVSYPQQHHPVLTSLRMAEPLDTAPAPPQEPPPRSPWPLWRIRELLNLPAQIDDPPPF